MSIDKCIMDVMPIFIKCIMDVMPIFALLIGQAEGILEKYCILAQSEVHHWLPL